MRSRGLLMLLVAGIAGLLAVVLAARWMQGQGGERGRIAVANADIELGGRISAEMIRMVDWPEGSVPAGAYLEPSKLDGRVLLVSIQRGEPITEGRLAPIGSKGGLSAVVPEGKRAMTVRVNDVVGVAGFALPGTFVDVMVNTQDERGTGPEHDRSISKIVLERILVLAVAQEADRDATKPKVVNAVTLEVTPKDAEMLDLARSVGSLSLVLRNQTDPKLENVATLGGATKAELLGLPSAPAERPAPLPVPAPHKVSVRVPIKPEAAPVVRVDCVDIIRGPNKVTECF